MLRKPTTPRPHPGVPHRHAPVPDVEFALDTGYVAVGGYGWVEIVARPQAARPTAPVALVLPAPSGTIPAECLLQPHDQLVIRNARGEIAAIAVQTIREHGSFAGFQVLDTSAAAPAAAREVAWRAFEQYLAGVSARTLNAQERDAASHN